MQELWDSLDFPFTLPESFHSSFLSEQVLELMEMAVLRDAHVGYPGISGLSVEQRKRLTIGVELVANPLNHLHGREASHIFSQACRLGMFLRHTHVAILGPCGRPSARP